MDSASQPSSESPPQHLYRIQDGRDNIYVVAEHWDIARVKWIAWVKAQDGSGAWKDREPDCDGIQKVADSADLIL